MMKKATLMLLSIFLVSINFVSAKCTWNNKEIPCDVFWREYGLFFFLIFGGVFLIIIPWFIFAILMIRDFYKKMSEYPDTFDSDWTIKWLFITAISGTLGLIVYYFAVYRKYKKIIPTQNKGLINSDSISANHFRKLQFPWNMIMNIFFLNFLNPNGYTDGGKLLLEDNKLIFKPHRFNMPGGKVEINFSEIKHYRIEKGANDKVKNVIIKTEYNDEKFVIWEKQTSVFIDTLKKGVNN